MPLPLRFLLPRVKLPPPQWMPVMHEVSDEREVPVNAHTAMRVVSLDRASCFQVKWTPIQQVIYRRGQRIES